MNRAPYPEGGGCDDSPWEISEAWATAAHPRIFSCVVPTHDCKTTLLALQPMLSRLSLPVNRQ